MRSSDLIPILERIAALLEGFRGCIEIHVDGGRPGQVRITQFVSVRELRNPAPASATDAQKADSRAHVRDRAKDKKGA